MRHHTAHAAGHAHAGVLFLSRRVLKDVHGRGALTTREPGRPVSCGLSLKRHLRVLQVVQQAARRRHQQVHALHQALRLRAPICAADDEPCAPRPTQKSSLTMLCYSQAALCDMRQLPDQVAKCVTHSMGSWPLHAQRMQQIWVCTAEDAAGRPENPKNPEETPAHRASGSAAPAGRARPRRSASPARAWG